MVSPFTLVVVSAAPVCGEDLAVEDHVGPALLRHSAQRVVQVRCGGGEDPGGFVAVAVGGGPGYTEPGCEEGQVFAFAVPDQHQ
jgi:hypothetical protein